MGSRIVGTGRATPRDRDLPISDLERRMDTSDEWIRTRTGIAQRHVMRSGESLVGNRGVGKPQRAGSRGPEARRARRDRRRHGFLGLRVSLVRLPVADIAGDRFDSRLRRGRGLFGLCLRAERGGLRDARRRLEQRAGGRRRCALHDGRLERTARPRCCSVTAPARPCWSRKPGRVACSAACCDRRASIGICCTCAQSRRANHDGRRSASRQLTTRSR